MISPLFPPRIGIFDFLFLSAADDDDDAAASPPLESKKGKGGTSCRALNAADEAEAPACFLWVMRGDGGAWPAATPRNTRPLPELASRLPVAPRDTAVAMLLLALPVAEVTVSNSLEFGGGCCFLFFFFLLFLLSPPPIAFILPPFFIMSPSEESFDNTGFTWRDSDSCEAAAAAAASAAGAASSEAPSPSAVIPSSKVFLQLVLISCAVSGSNACKTIGKNTDESSPILASRSS